MFIIDSEDDDASSDDDFTDLKDTDIGKTL